jgi:hypothetical protein
MRELKLSGLIHSLHQLSRDLKIKRFSNIELGLLKNRTSKASVANYKRADIFA